MGNGQKVGPAMDRTMQVFNSLLVIGFLGIVWLMIYGNLSTNLGFADSTTGFNNTENVIANLTQGVNTFFTFSNVLFTITAIALLITILIGLLFLVLTITKAFRGAGGSSFSE